MKVHFLIPLCLGFFISKGDNSTASSEGQGFEVITQVECSAQCPAGRRSGITGGIYYSCRSLGSWWGTLLLTPSFHNDSPEKLPGTRGAQVPRGGTPLSQPGTERTPIQEAELSAFIYNSHLCELGRVALSLGLSFPTVVGGTSLALTERSVLGPSPLQGPTHICQGPSRGHGGSRPGRGSKTYFPGEKACASALRSRGQASKAAGFGGGAMEGGGRLGSAPGESDGRR